MLLFTVIGVVLDVIGAIILAYPQLYPEDVRTGRMVKPEMHIQKALEKIGKPYFWTDKKINTVGLAVLLIGATFTIIGLVYS